MKINVICTVARFHSCSDTARSELSFLTLTGTKRSGWYYPVFMVINLHTRPHWTCVVVHAYLLVRFTLFRGLGYHVN